MTPPVNPILRGFYPDPSVCRVGETYYFVNSTFEYLPGLPIHASTDLQNWTLVGHAIHSPRQLDFSATGGSRGLYAPTLRHHDGRFYLACTDVDGAGNFYLTASDVAGPWSDPVLLPEARGIDPSLFFHEGRAWWTGCREVAEPTFDGETEVWLRELDLERGQFVGEERVIWTRTLNRAVWAEGPHLYHRDGWFYLLTAEGGTEFNHSVMVARSREVTGPYLGNPRNPILTHRHLGHGAAVQNVGHAELFEGTDGQWWAVALAVRPIDGHHILGRETHLAAVTWEDDWPVINAGLGRLDDPVARIDRTQSHGVPRVEDFLSLHGFADFSEPGDSALVIRPAAEREAVLLRRLTSTRCTVAVTFAAIEDAVTVALVLRQSDAFRSWLELASSAGRLTARVVCRQGEDMVVATLDVSVADTIVLEARLEPSTITWSVNGVVVGTTAFAALSTETAGGFVGTTWGPGVAGAEASLTAWSQQDLE